MELSGRLDSGESGSYNRAFEYSEFVPSHTDSPNSFTKFGIGGSLSTRPHELSLQSTGADYEIT